jgi:anaerobic selenocysteine-containing dehydrogenase
MVKVTTHAGEEIIELKVTPTARPGQVIMPHGFGLIYQGKKHGPNVN